MKKSIVVITLTLAGSLFAASSNRWSQPDEEKPKQSFDYFIAGDDETTYVKLNDNAKSTLKKMLDNSADNNTLSDVIRRVRNNVRTQAGREALDALKEMADNDPDMTAGVVKDGIFGNGKMFRKASVASKQQSEQSVNRY